MIQLSLSQASADFQIDQRNFTLAPSVEVPALKPDPTRWGLYIVCTNSPSSAIIYFKPGGGPAMGIPISAKTPPVELWFGRHANLPQQAWYLFSTVGGENIAIYQILYRPGQPSPAS